jgi:iron(III) transport system substrate-binding protein
LFGTTATHFLVLRQHWGADRFESWCRSLTANKPLLVDGNSIVVKFVGRGEAWIGLTDSDDIAAGQRDGLPVAALPLTEEMLLIPNTVAVVRNAPHPEAAQKVFTYLGSTDVLSKLIAANALEGIASSEITDPTLKPDWDALVRDLEVGTKKLKEIFLR